MNNLNLLDSLALFSSVLQIYNTFENTKQTELLQELENQDGIMDNQDKLLLMILAKLNEIESKLEELKK